VTTGTVYVTAIPVWAITNEWTITSSIKDFVFHWHYLNLWYKGFKESYSNVLY